MNPEIQQLQQINDLINATLHHMRERGGFTHTQYGQGHWGYNPWYSNTPTYPMTPWTHQPNYPMGYNTPMWNPGFQHTPYWGTGWFGGNYPQYNYPQYTHPQYNMPNTPMTNTWWGNRW